MECSQEMSETVAIYDLPQDICNKIAGYVSCGSDLCSLRLASKSWKAAASLQVYVSNFKSKSVLRDSELLQFANEFPRVHTLKPVGRNITAHGLAKACASLERLQSVDIRACPQVTAIFLERIKDFPNIRWAANRVGFGNSRKTMELHNSETLELHNPETS